VPRESGAAAWNFSGARPTHKLNGLCRGEYIYDLAMFSPHCDSAHPLFVSAARRGPKAISPPLSARRTRTPQICNTIVYKLCEALQFHLTASADQFNYAQFIFTMCANDNKTMAAAAKTNECVRKWFISPLSQ